MRALALVLTLLFSIPAGAASNADWTTPLPPFQIADHLYYVGSRELASYLITTPVGNILINANLATSPPQIRASIERLGFRWSDTRVLLNSQAHFDHVGGAARVVRETHAQVMVMDGDAAAMSTGGRADFAFGDDITTAFTPTHVDRVLQDASPITLGDPARGGVTVIARKTAGHTRGCTTFTLRAHIPGDPPGKFRDIVIVGGFAALAHYRLLDAPGRPASYPGIADDFHRSFALMRTLPCDVFLGAHGGYFDLLAKLARMPEEGPAVFIDPAGYQARIADAQEDFEAIVARQRN